MRHGCLSSNNSQNRCIELTLVGKSRSRPIPSEREVIPCAYRMGSKAGRSRNLGKRMFLRSTSGLKCGNLLKRRRETDEAGLTVRNGKPPCCLYPLEVISIELSLLFMGISIVYSLLIDVLCEGRGPDDAVTECSCEGLLSGRSPQQFLSSIYDKIRKMWFAIS
jgi:hypothetical protein